MPTCIVKLCDKNISHIIWTWLLQILSTGSKRRVPELIRLFVSQLVKRKKKTRQVTCCLYTKHNISWYKNLHRTTNPLNSIFTASWDNNGHWPQFPINNILPTWMFQLCNTNLFWQIQVSSFKMTPYLHLWHKYPLSTMALKIKKTTILPNIGHFKSFRNFLIVDMLSAQNRVFTSSHDAKVPFGTEVSWCS